MDIFSLPVLGQNFHKLYRDEQLHKLSQSDYRTHSKVKLQLFCLSAFYRVVQYSKRFENYGHLSLTVRGHTTSQTVLGRTHRAMNGHTPKVNLSFFIDRLSPGEHTTSKTERGNTQLQKLNGGTHNFKN